MKSIHPSTTRPLGAALPHRILCRDRGGNLHPQGFQDKPSQGPFREGDDFRRSNVFISYCFNRNFDEASEALLNLTDEDYRLSPPSPYFEVDLVRTFVLRFRAGF